MKFKNIEVYGINRIIFNGKDEWNKEQDKPVAGVIGNWKNARTGEVQEHEGVMGVVNILKHSLKYEMSTNVDTLYITKVEKPLIQDKVKHEITGKEIRELKNTISKLQSM